MEDVGSDATPGMWGQITMLIRVPRDHTAPSVEAIEAARRWLASTPADQWTLDSMKLARKGDTNADTE